LDEANDARHSTGGTTHHSSVRVGERASAVQDADHLDLIAGDREQNPIATMAPPMDQLPDLSPRRFFVEDPDAPLRVLMQSRIPRMS
jgi:hypothetical protein